MIKRKGDLFSSNATALGHGVNCKGLMGGGIAVEFKKRLPSNYKSYKEACDKGEMTSGAVHIGFDNDLTIFNMATQVEPGADARYEGVFFSGLQTARYCVEKGIDRVAIPLIGCGIGGLEWNKVEPVLLSIENIVDNNFQWEVWKF